MVSFLTLDSELEEVLDPSLTTLPLGAPSLSTSPRDNTPFTMT